MKNWHLELGFIPGFLFGVRTYLNDGFAIHVLYIGCFDLALTLEDKIKDEE
tara:strand:+ start:11663 stop:11815 length:153 start_codon:yes stop_codon:yes gene_type:complete